jgi:hypothetical protein
MKENKDLSTGEKNKNNKTRKFIKNTLIVILSVILVIAITGICLRLIPINRNFSSIYEREPFSEVFVIQPGDLPEIMIFGSDSHPYHYQAVCGHRIVYIYSDTKFSEGDTVEIKSRLIGIVIHSTDNSGIWMRYPVFVYEC